MTGVSRNKVTVGEPAVGSPPYLKEAFFCSAHTDCLIESEKQGVLRSRLIRPLRLEAQDTALSRR